MTTAEPGSVNRRTLRALRPMNPLTRPVRMFGALVMVAAVFACVYWNQDYRAFEAFLAAIVLSPFAHGTGASGTTFYLQQPTGMIGLVITAECTALILIAPLVALAAALLVLTRVHWWRIAAGLGAMWVVVTSVNEVRLAFIAFASDAWGVDLGYPLSHTYIGSVIGILGFVAGLAVLLIITGTVRRR
ncbi:hypothetical protein [Curtobacterium sp. MCSS17_008]|uniref:hypothetical protein n=1 Tax=Curtobacterium sp. MCSS17_008 TaxID=2175647 RepID=UPI0015E87D04|nr:hypothetical protein [Curtobacterium sp. MCSS17_008]